MLSVDVATLLDEVGAIGRDIAWLAAHGADPREIDEARRRHRRLCDALLERLRDRLCAERCAGRVH